MHYPEEEEVVMEEEAEPNNEPDNEPPITPSKDQLADIVDELGIEIS